MAGIVASLLGLLQLIILVRAVLSWVQPAPGNPIIAALDVVCEPLLAPIRHITGASMGIDISPLIAIVGLQILRSLVMQLGAS